MTDEGWPLLAGRWLPTDRLAATHAQFLRVSSYFLLRRRYGYARIAARAYRRRLWGDDTNTRKVPT